MEERLITQFAASCLSTTVPVLYRPKTEPIKISERNPKETVPKDKSLPRQYLMFLSKGIKFFVSCLIIGTFRTATCFSPGFAVKRCCARDPRHQTRDAILFCSSNGEELLSEVSIDYLVGLCRQYSLNEKGTKQDLLLRLREFAKEQSRKEMKRLEMRRQRIDEGAHDEREVFEILGGDENEIEDEGFFFYASAPEATGADRVARDRNPSVTKNSLPQESEPASPSDHAEDRVETIFSTTEENDLTSIAASQPGQSSFGDPSVSRGVTDNTSFSSQPAGASKKKATGESITQARDAVHNIFQDLLSRTGLAGFAPATADVSHEGTELKFEGFDPSRVSTHSLDAVSQSLRLQHGKILAEISREFELRGVAFDGVAGDDVEKGGGHYREVRKVKSFLEGYRQAEGRRLARETIALLLDRLVADGIEGLDVALATMARSGDEEGNDIGDLNDSLLDFLNDAIRQQDKKVEQVADNAKTLSDLELTLEDTWVKRDAIEDLWSVANIDGQRVETFNPKDPENTKALKAELKKESSLNKRQPIPKSDAEKVLLLLRLLRERLKVEAMFSHDEKARNLRVLGYCLKLDSTDVQKELIAMELGQSIDVSRFCVLPPLETLLASHCAGAIAIALGFVF